MMPPKGQAFRAKQLGQLARMTHEMQVQPEIGDLLAACETDANLTADPLGPTTVNIRQLRRNYQRATKLPGDLVAERAETASMARAQWAQARKDNCFDDFRPWLEKLILLQRRAAECYGWPAEGEPWDALADGYEPESSARQITGLFAPLREKLVVLVQRLQNSGHAPEPIFNDLELPVDRQHHFVRMVAERIGFDFSAGRLDQSVHPFCSGTHCHDVRMTTRFSGSLVDALSSTMHESGHGMYAQGLPEAHLGTPMGDDVSLGIHESQSRIWENHVGRSPSFWAWCLPRIIKHFQLPADRISPDEAYRAVNRVQPGLIRVEADEVTYNLHIMVRFELERSMLRGDLSVADLPGAWDERYREYLGIEVPDDTHGCLQDVHWSMGAIGYFSTYTLGNLYAAQFFERATRDMPDLFSEFACGRFDSLKNWLYQKIYQHGQRYRADELCQHVTGQALSADSLLRHLEQKYQSVYRID